MKLNWISKVFTWVIYYMSLLNRAGDAGAVPGGKDVLKGSESSSSIARRGFGKPSDMSQWLSLQDALD